ncbi:MAG: sugar phosphate nucleotidyltransferase [Bacteroidales bacterium]|jgi:mannose-1-phosphate guanylyltransferase|nr:sugar phosphate nucleotidyltransferase [Bacteroidales bacterium]
MNENHYAVIMAGGVGSRFWPMSKTATPKQFLDILGTGETLIRQTFTRLSKICPIPNIYIVTSKMYKNLVLEQLPEMRSFAHNILCEPVRRNTAPCIAYASAKIMKINPNAKIIVAPSDHIIMKENIFLEVVNAAMEEVAKKDCLMTLGITPSRPDTGYGYIQIDDTEDKKLTKDIFKVKTFTEKPNLEMAEFFIESGDFVWNAGIFIWSVKSIYSALKQYLPDIFELFFDEKILYNTAYEDADVEKTYYACPNISIDYGIMEKANNVYVYKTDFGWSDLGTWVSLFENSEKDSDNNVVKSVDVVECDSINNIVVAKNKLVALQGLDNYIVVDSDDVLLVCKKTDEQKIRNLVDAIKRKYGEKYI